MIKLNNCIVLLLLFHGIYFSMELDSSETNIDSIVKAADAVVLHEEHFFSISSDNYSTYSMSKKILIKNKKALKYCKLVLIENEFQEITELNGIIKDTSGAVVKELDTDDIWEAEISPGFVFYSGNKYKGFSLKYNKFPFVIELTAEQTFNTLFVWPDYYPQYDIPNLNSTYRLRLSNNIKFKYMTIGEIDDPAVTKYEDVSEYVWHIENLPPRITEDYMPPENKTQTAVKFSPSNFVLDGHKGSFDSWNEFAKWYKSLSDDKYELPENAKREIEELVKGVKSPKEKVRILYNYLQRNTRYVALEMGIGGWQPHSAELVYKNLYGDCKDLSTFMVALLGSAGIKSYPALARTRDRGRLEPDFVTNGFNHLITFVPLAEDTLWLECTSSYTDMSDAPYSIEDISALVVDDNGGRLVTTPHKSSKENFWFSVFKGKISRQWNLDFSAELNCGGNPKNYVKAKLDIKDEEEDILYLRNRFGGYIPNLYIDDYNINYENDKNYKLNFEGKFFKYINPIRRRVFINPAIFNRETNNDLPDESKAERKFPVFYNYPYTYKDSVSIAIPKYFKLEVKPKNIYINTSFAEFNANFDFVGNEIKYVRILEIKNNLIPLENYSEYYDFMKAVIKADKSKYVIRTR